MGLVRNKVMTSMSVLYQKRSVITINKTERSPENSKKFHQEFLNFSHVRF